jgi:hypothetical protein
LGEAEGEAEIRIAAFEDSAAFSGLAPADGGMIYI